MFRFDVKKAVQAAAVVLEVEGGSMSYFRLLKLLYLADRDSMMETGFPITYTHAFALDHGPMPSEIYDLVKGARVDEREWTAYIKTHAYRINVVPGADPGRGKLSRYEIEKLRQVAEKFETLNDWELADLTHTLAEYQKNEPPRGSSNPIPVADILEAVGMGEHTQSILEELKDKERIDELVASYKH